VGVCVCVCVCECVCVCVCVCVCAGMPWCTYKHKYTYIHTYSKYIRIPTKKPKIDQKSPAKNTPKKNICIMQCGYSCTPKVSCVRLFCTFLLSVKETFILPKETYIFAGVCRYSCTPKFSCVRPFCTSV